MLVPLPATWAAQSTFLSKRWAGYVIGLSFVALVTAAGFGLLNVIGRTNLAMLYLLPIVATALRWRRSPAITVACASALAFEFCFVPPRFTFVLRDSQHAITLVCFLVVAVVISQLATAQAARIEAESSSRAKDLVLASVSHELRTPVTAMLGWSRALRAGKLKATPEALETIERNAGLQLRLVEDLLDASRAVSNKLRLNFSDVDLREMLEASRNLLLPAAESKNIALEYGLCDCPCQISADPARLQQVVANLVGNAIKFTPEGGHVRVRLEHTADTASISVGDDGIGIAPELLPRVFEAFRQGDSPASSEGGLGLGLFISRAIVDLHGGRIVADSAGIGKGATFRVALPLETAAWRPALATAIAPRGAGTREH